MAGMFTRLFLLESIDYVVTSVTRGMTYFAPNAVSALIIRSVWHSICMGKLQRRKSGAMGRDVQWLPLYAR